LQENSAVEVLRFIQSAVEVLLICGGCDADLEVFAVEMLLKCGGSAAAGPTSI
jgi:hypothetical protein